MKKAKDCKNEKINIVILILTSLFVFLMVFRFLKRKKTLKKTNTVGVSLENAFDLNDRQKKILVIFESSGEVTVDELLEKIGGVTERTIRRDMNKFVSLGFVEKQGNTKGSKYIFTK